MTGTTRFENGDSVVERVVDGRRKLTALRARYSEHSLTTPIQFVGFWAAVALPFLYVPLFLNGLAGAELTVFSALLACNVLALFVGHSYGRE
ncbi:hypothetical protein [Haladaptatus salinisoli]|uniref:hypothetical protein n=1 Tax=Haladaptatus salinisoli TaxID=2884876 RepID=UPI001D0AE335|nr:hypothetical protein [Haladaptatus salinisoli]